MINKLISGFFGLIMSIFGITTAKKPEIPKVTPSPVISVTENRQVIPLPTGEDIIRTFFELIKEKRFPEAIGMMSKKLIPDGSTEQAYAVTFNNFGSLNITSIEPYNKEGWPTNKEIYKVALEIYLVDSSKQPMIWDNGTNIRFISLSKNSQSWKIEEIATGP